MSDKRLIDANALHKVFDAMHAIPGSSHLDHLVLLGIKKFIDDTPTIDAVEVVHGRWVFDRPNHYKCSLCDAMWSGVARFMKFCPNCGAKMDGGAQC